VPLPGVLQRVLDWLHAGYPTGIPQTDYYPLLAFLARRMTTDEVVEVVKALQGEGRLDYRTTSDEVRAAIETVTNSPVVEADVQRVERHLRESGWESEPAADR
jgi:Protein of unknown function (DUF3349)